LGTICPPEPKNDSTSEEKIERIELEKLSDQIYKLRENITLADICGDEEFWNDFLVGNVDFADAYKLWKE